MKNKYVLLAKRTLACCLLTVDDERQGRCYNCARCCQIAFRCPFLNEHNRCRIYKVRPINCRKYPRVRKEQVVHPCGYYF